VAAVAASAPAAHAASLPVLGPDGTITHRRDPGVAARDRALPPHAAPVARAAASAAKRTTLSELKRLNGNGSLDDDQYASDKQEYQRDQALARKLTGRRKIEMAGVLRTVDQMAARGSLTAPRLVPLFLQLQRNRQWWSTGPLLANGARVSFKGSELVFQYVPGEGLQIHPLANFGKLNALWRSKLDADRMQALLGELLPLAVPRAGGVAWEYYFDFGGGAPPWVSSLAQGTGLQSMARAAHKAGTGDVVYPVLAQGLGIFKTRTPSGVAVPVGAGTHYAQYSFAPGLRILNGFVQSLVGLYDFGKITGNVDAQKLFAAGEARALQEVPTYDTGAWSLYDRGTDSHESNLNYHQVLIEFLDSLCSRTDEPTFCDALAHFRAYMKEDPEVAVVTDDLKAGKPGALKFTLSKIAAVHVSLTRGGRIVYSTTTTYGRGTKSITVTPPKGTKEYVVHIDATDLAGNAASTDDTVAVHK
jgi:D-glucuronyl C5-epimerase C-terminus